MLKVEGEHKLIKKLIRGDADSFDEIFRKYNEKIYAFSFSNLKSKEDAEFVVQEVFLNLWKDRAKLKELKSLNAWVFTISYNIIRKRFRQLASESQHLKKFSKTIPEEDSSLEKFIDQSDLLENADKIINKLPPRQKSVLLLSTKEALSNDEIAAKLHISKKTVENHLSLAKTYLRKSFHDEIFFGMLIFCLFVK